MTAPNAVPCYRWGGEMEAGTTSFCYTEAGHTFLLENVSALICSESSFDGPTFDTIQRIVREKWPPPRVAEVGVHDLTSAPYAAEAVKLSP